MIMVVYRLMDLMAKETFGSPDTCILLSTNQLPFVLTVSLLFLPERQAAVWLAIED